jgi:general L-amino acid transport system permease protein
MKTGIAGWVRRNLFGSWLDGAITLLILAFLVWAVPGILSWALVDAVWHAPDMRSCRAAGNGACWAFIGEKARFILFGRYPYGHQSRAAEASLLILGLMAASSWPRLWGRLLVVAWGIGILAALILMRGGLFGLMPIETDLWGGLPVTLLLSIFSMVIAFPLAVLLALGRRSPFTVMRAVAIACIEIVRGVPLVTILFMTTLMLPLFLPADVSLDKFTAALIGFAVFLAAYWAEDIRAGLQAVPKGQDEAAEALGLSYADKMRLVILPQALALVIGPMVGTAIGNFKNTSLVVIIGVFDLMLATQTALIDPNWRGLTLEAYLFLGALYLVVCLALTRYGRLLERRARVVDPSHD